MPKVSVLMANYNAGSFIEEAIKSILGQTYIDFEFIIVDDGSIDKSWEIIKKYSVIDSRIQCYRNIKNSGIAYTRNRLIHLAKGEYIAWIDADDRARPERLQKQVLFLLSNPNISIVGSWLDIIDTYGNHIRKKRLPVSDRMIKKQWFLRSTLNNPTLMITKKCIEETGLYDSAMDGAEDYDFLIRAGTKHACANIPETLMEYRIHGDNITQKKQKDIIQKTLKIRRKMRHMGYVMGGLDWCAYGLTWFTQFIPANITSFLFFAIINFLPNKTRKKQ